MEFIEFAQLHGLVIRDLIRGRITRCTTENHRHKKNGAFFFDGEWGWIQDHAIHHKIILWKTDKPLTAKELADMRKRMEVSKAEYRLERSRMQQDASDKAKWILSQCALEQHAVLDSHGFPNMLGNVWRPNDHDNLLVIPMRVSGAIVGCQLISRDNQKKFLTGQRCGNAEFIIGTSGKDFVVEGYCTGLALHKSLESLKIPTKVHVTFSAGNLTKIGKTLKNAVIVCDNDKSGVGKLAAQETGHRFYVPEVEGEDWCDVWQRLGSFQSGQLLRKFLISEKIA